MLRVGGVASVCEGCFGFNRLVLWQVVGVVVYKAAHFFEHFLIVWDWVLGKNVLSFLVLELIANLLNWDRVGELLLVVTIGLRALVLELLFFDEVEAGNYWVLWSLLVKVFYEVFRGGDALFCEFFKVLVSHFYWKEIFLLIIIN